MRRYSSRELRTAILVTVLLTALAMVALLDRSCSRSPESGRAHYPNASIHRTGSHEGTKITKPERWLACPGSGPS
jgi:hypothetical protein